MLGHFPDTCRKKLGLCLTASYVATIHLLRRLILILTSEGQRQGMKNVHYIPTNEAQKYPIYVVVSVPKSLISLCLYDELLKTGNA